MAFKPHGLIRTKLQQALYNRAHIANVYVGIANPKESETTALVEVVLQQNIFFGEDWASTSQIYPSPNSKRRCDIGIRYLESGTLHLKVLCFTECKRSSTSQPFSLKKLEVQAFEYCEEYLEYYVDISFIYATTAAGAHMRLWKHERGMKAMIPFWGPAKEGDWSQYKDMGDDTARIMIEGGFNQMKILPPSARDGQTYEDYQSNTSYDQPEQSTAYNENTPYASSTSYDQPSYDQPEQSTTYNENTPYASSTSYDQPSHDQPEQSTTYNQNIPYTSSTSHDQPEQSATYAYRPKAAYGPGQSTTSYETYKQTLVPDESEPRQPVQPNTSSYSGSAEILDASQCSIVKVTRTVQSKGKTYWRCSRKGEADLEVDATRWSTTKIYYNGRTRDCYKYKSHSGVTYVVLIDDTSEGGNERANKARRHK